MNKRVVLTGLGVVSSIGIGWQEFWDSLLKGKSGISPVTAFDTSNHFTHNGGEVKEFKHSALLTKEQREFTNRSSQMALEAARLAIEDAGLSRNILESCTVGVSFGTTLGDAQTIEDIDALLVEKKIPQSGLFRQLPTHSAPCHIARKFGCSGPNFMFSTACAAGNYAIAYGFDLIRMNRVDIVIAGASDPQSRIEFTGFNQFKAVAPERCRPFDKERKGMIPGEGAGVAVLEGLESALKRKAPIYAEIAGYGLSCDAHHMTSPAIDGISMCMKKALKESNLRPDQVDYISAHGTGTANNDRTESAAIKEVFGPRYKDIPVSSIKSMLGHTMGAASALEAVACALAVKNDMIPPTINFETPDPECDIDCVPNTARRHRVDIALNNSYAFGGNDACLILKKVGNIN